MKPRVVFDTSTVVSALLFGNGRLAWLRLHWQSVGCVPLTSAVSATELTRVLGYAKFQLSADDREDLLEDYLPFCEVITVAEKCSILCRDIQDQPFLDLAEGGKAGILVTGDRGLLALAGKTPFAIETPEAYRIRTRPVTEPETPGSR